MNEKLPNRDDFPVFHVYTNIKDEFARQIARTMPSRTWNLIKVDEAIALLDKTLNAVALEELKHLQEQQRALLAVNEDEGRDDE